MQWILGIALAAAVFVVLKQWGQLTPEKRSGAIWKLVLVVGAALLVFMVLTGRVHILTAAVAGLIPLLRKLPALLKLVPAFRQHMGTGYGGKQSSGESSFRTPPSGNRMSEQEACDLLGVARGCSREQVVEAHRRLIQKLHPDRGGNDYLAAKINEARQVLLDLYDTRD